MTQARHRISAVICALNEGSNIGRCIRSLRGQPVGQIILVDGGSTDNTIQEARAAHGDILVLSLPQEGLLRQRAAGIGVASGDLVLLIDADDELAAGSVEASLAYLSRRDLDGVQFGYSEDDRTPWSRRWSIMLDISVPVGHRLPMLGRPALMRRDVFPAHLDPADLPSALPAAIEDSFIHEAFLRSHPPLRFAGGPGKTCRIQPTTLGEVIRKSWAYGIGDALQVSRFGNLGGAIYHSLWRYPVVRGARAIRRREAGAALLSLLVGGIRLVGMFVELGRRRLRPRRMSARPTGP